MISIIICSADKAALDKAIQSIKQTIGVVYETIVIDNKYAKLSLSTAYNKGAAKARFNILCFMHEDISFETNNWGKNVVAHLGDISVGLIGVAGGDTKSLAPSSWSSSVFQSEISIVQHFKFENKPPERIIKTGYPDNQNQLKPVVCLDGVWLCTRKDVFELCRFDERSFQGFHGYDIDFSLQVFQHCKVGVVFDVVLHHYSEGNYDKTWLRNMMLVSKKWKHRLPMSVRTLQEDEWVEQHWTCIHVFLDYLLELKYKLPLILYYFLRYSSNRFFRIKQFRFYLAYIFENYQT